MVIKKDLNGKKFIKKIDISMKFRSSHRRCSATKGVLRNFVKFTDLCQSLFFNKAAG